MILFFRKKWCPVWFKDSGVEKEEKRKIKFLENYSVWLVKKNTKEI